MDKELIKEIMFLIKLSVDDYGVRGFARKVGISPAIVSRYLNKKTITPSFDVLQKLSNYFKVGFVIEITPDCVSSESSVSSVAKGL